MAMGGGVATRKLGAMVDFHADVPGMSSDLCQCAVRNDGQQNDEHPQNATTRPVSHDVWNSAANTSWALMPEGPCVNKRKIVKEGATGELPDTRVLCLQTGANLSCLPLLPRTLKEARDRIGGHLATIR